MRRSVSLATTACLALTVAACGNSPTSGGDNASAAVSAHAKGVYDEIAGLTGQARTDKLVEMAEKEGQLAVYTSNTDLEEITDAFSEVYDIDVEVYRAQSEGILQRVTQEAKAHYNGVDLIETNAGGLGIMASEDLLYPYESEHRDALRPEARRAADWTGTRFELFVAGWNTDKVRPGQEPTSFEDFAEPAWKGRVSMEIGDVDWFATLWRYYEDKGWSEDKIQDMFEAIASNSKVVAGHTTQAELLAAGQFDVAISPYSHAIEKGADDGQPLAWEPSTGDPVQPVILRASGAALSTTASHPAAALLFMDYLISEDGQKFIADAHRPTALPMDSDPTRGLETLTVDDALMTEEGDEWSRKYEELLRRGSQQE